MQTDPSLPIGLLDSGVGGLSVLQELTSLLPNENTLYFADQKNFPYGEKTPEELIECSSEVADFLFAQGIKILVVACHTASAHTLAALKKRFPIPIVGMIGPTIAEVLTRQRKKRIAILGTKATLSSGIYERALSSSLPEVYLCSQPCPELIELVQQNRLEEAHQVAEPTLSHLQKEHLDLAILGSTHLPYVRSAIQDALGSEVELIDPAKSVALSIQTILKKQHLLNSSSASHRFFASKDAASFESFLSEFFCKNWLNKVQEVRNESQETHPTY